MPPLNVPPHYRPGLAALLRMTPAQVERFTSTLARSSSSDVDVPTRSAVGTSDISEDGVRDVVRTLRSLYALRAKYGQSASSLAADIVDAISRNSYPNLMVPDEEQEDARNKLTKILGVDEFLYRQKIRGVLDDHQFLYCAARILTDIRPVFATDTSDDLIDARVTHTLKITYHEGEEHEEIFMALDEQGIKELRSVLDRAESKAARLKKVADAMKKGEFD